MKTAVITGATKGIGRALVEVFAKAGFNLAVCARTKSDLKKLENELKSQYPTIEILSVATDMSKRKSVDKFGDKILKKWKSVDVLVNNAGAFRQGDLMSEDFENLEFMMNLNVYGVYHLTRKLAPAMLAQNDGHIFNICSVASIKALSKSGSYGITKYALLGFTHNLREELKDKGVKVTAVLPGATWSDSWAGVDLPEDRLMPAKDVAQSVLDVYNLGKNTVVEEIVLRPQLGDL